MLKGSVSKGFVGLLLFNLASIDYAPTNGFIVGTRICEGGLCGGLLRRKLENGGVQRRSSLQYIKVIIQGSMWKNGSKGMFFHI